MKNIKATKKCSCNCLTKSHPINKTVVLFTPSFKARNERIIDICITLYIDCSSTFEDDFHDNTMVMWPLYEECIQGVDTLTNNLDECECALSEGEMSRGSLILEVPQQYANCTLCPFMRVVVKLSQDASLDRYQAVPNLNDKLISERTTLFCRKGYDSVCSSGCNCL